MSIRLVALCLFITFTFVSCSSPQPPDWTWESMQAGDTFYPGSQAIYVQKTNSGSQNRGYLRGVAAENGATLWELKVEGNTAELAYWRNEQESYQLKLDSYPGNSTVAANLNTNVVGFDEASGVVLVKTSETAIRDTITEFQRLYALRLEDGEILWKVGMETIAEDALGFEIGELAIYDGLVCFVSGKYTALDSDYYASEVRLNAYSPTTGQIWSSQLDSVADLEWEFPARSIHYADGKLYFSGYPSQWQLSSGEWLDLQSPVSFPEANGVFASVFDNGIGYVAYLTSSSSISEGDFVIAARSQTTGEALWEFKEHRQNTTQVNRGPLLAETRLYASQGDTLYVLDKFSGVLIASSKLPAQIDDLLLQADRLYALSGGKLYAFDPAVWAEK